MRIHSIQTLCRAGGLLGLLLIVPGCAFSEKIGVDETGAPVYERLHIVYDIESPDASPADAVVGSSGHASPERHAHSGWQSPAWSKVQLKVEYPHPEAPQQFGRATVVYFPAEAGGVPVGDGSSKGRRTGLKRLAFWSGGESASDNQQITPAGATISGEIDELPAATGGGEIVRILDVPKLELDLLLVDLAGSGFFDDQHRPSARTRLDVKINRGRVAKQWTPEPRLDDLMETIAEYGTQGD